MSDDAAFTVVVTFRCRREHLDEVLAELARNAHESLREPGCHEFTVLRDLRDDLAFLLYERYRDERAFREEHRGTSHYARWSAVAARCLDGASSRRELFNAACPG